MPQDDPVSACMVIARYLTTADQSARLLDRLHDYERLLRRQHLLTDVQRLQVEDGEILEIMEIQEWADAQAPQRVDEDEESRSAWRAIRAQVTDVHQVILG